jgi:hypothetical protein
MSTSTIKQNIIYGLGEGAQVTNSTMLAYALRYANAAYRDIFGRYRLKNLRTRSVFRTSAGQSSYQAPASYMGFLILKDESNDTIIDQITPETFMREVSSKSVSEESFTSDFDVAVQLDNVGIIQYSETVTSTDGLTTFTRDSDYTMGYSAGTIEVDSTGTMADSTEYYIDYIYLESGNPKRFCIEYDAANGKYVYRFDPVPDSEKVITLLYEQGPSDLSGSIDPIWNRLEYCIERGGIYFGCLELIEDQNKRNMFKGDYEGAIEALVFLDNDLIPKHDRIPVIMRKSDYTSVVFNKRN